MGIVNVALWIGGAALMAIGYSRFRGPWSRYQAMKEEDANAKRYAAWRGGVHDEGTTGASVAMDILQRQARIGLAIIVAGIVLVFLGFLLK
jgi:hypothetical protein